MVEQLAQNWWALALRGIVAIAFGVLAIMLPGLTLLALVFLFAAYAIVDGAFLIVSGIRGQGGRGGTRWLVIGGIAGVAAGIVTIVWPGLTALLLLSIIAAWAIVTGILVIVAAYRLREAIRGEWLLALEGALSVAFGFAIILFPGAGALAVIWLIAAYAIASGVVLLILSFRLRRFKSGFGSSRSPEATAH
jgi:uncharacterized membrane protein HdeD (DUF308 family)